MSFAPCSTCHVDRLASTLDERGQCPFCIDEGTPPPEIEPKYAPIVVVPSKNTGRRAPPPPESATPRAARAEQQATLDEAYALPYAAPAFDAAQAEADPAKELAMRALCRRRLLPFVQRFRPKYLAGWVHEDICRRLERFVKAVEASESPRLLLLLPPRSGKSELGSRNFPPWVLGQHPDWEVIAASHTQSLTLSFSRYVRDLVRDPAYKAIFPTMVLDPNSQSIENWNTLSGGGYMAAGVGTGISGRGCHCLPLTERIHTQNGLMSINELINDSEATHYVLAYTLGKLEYRRISGYITRETGSFYRVRLSNGATFEATGEHPVCVDLGEGSTPSFRRVDDLRAGESVVTFECNAANTPSQVANEVPCVLDALHKKPIEFARSTEGVRDADTHLQQQMHGSDAHGDDDATKGLSHLRQIIQRCEVRALKAVGARGFVPFLFERVLRSSPFKNLRWGKPPQLQQGENSLHSMCERVPSNGGRYEAMHNCATVLQQGMLWQMVNWSSYPIGYRSSWATIISSRVQSNAQEVVGGRGGMCRVYVPSDGVTPQRQQHREQLPGESSGGVQKVSQTPSYWATASTIESIEEIIGKVIVGDIEVDGAHNFLHESCTLQLNCLIIDDVVKDAEASDSVTIRENTWEWYISTAYTRLAPGGGVLGILCMVGDTPVLMAEGTQRRLDSLTVSDEIATYDRGRLSTSRIKGLRSNGSDSVLRITTLSGKIVRANERHPFLTTTPTGKLAWTRVRNLTTAHRIVTAKVSGGSGKDLCASLETATQKWYAEGTVSRTMQKSGGLMATVVPQMAPNREETPNLSTDMASPLRITTDSLMNKVGCAPSAKNHQMMPNQPTGRTGSPSITATTQAKYAPCCATTAMQESGTLELSPWHLPQHGISDFILDEVVSIEPDGVEEVFDLQVYQTENFIANGMVSHNTWWHEDDWAGRIQEVMKSGDGDVFEVVKYPAINEDGDEYILPDDSIAQFAPESDPPPPGSRLTRSLGTAIHPARYTTAMMLKIKNNLLASGLKRVWNALYQQNPVPDDGVYFTKEMMRWYDHPPRREDMFVYQAWDFAITEKTESDWTVCCTIGQDEMDNLFILHILRFRSGDGNAIVDDVLDQFELFKPDLIGFEDGQIWKSLTSQFKKRCDERGLFPNHELLQPLTDKKVRAGPLKGRMQQGKVFTRRNQQWTEPFRQEFMKFPSGKNDDCHTFNTLIDSHRGQARIGELRDGDEILTYDGESLVTGTVSGHHCTGIKKVLEITFNDGTIVEMTPGHPVLTAAGYTYAGDLTSSDNVVRKRVCKSRNTASNGRKKQRGITSQPSALAARDNGYTDTPTARNAGSSHQVGTCIISTGTKTTTSLGTWLASHIKGISWRIVKKWSRLAIVLRNWLISRLSALSHLLQRLVPTLALESCAKALPGYEYVDTVPWSSNLKRQTRTTLVTALKGVRGSQETCTLTAHTLPNKLATTVAPSSHLDHTVSAIPSFAQSSAETGTDTKTSISRGLAEVAERATSFVKATLRRFARHVWTKVRTVTGASVPVVGSRFYPASKMEPYSAIESVLTSSEDFEVTRRSLLDSNRQFVKVVSVREIGFHPTYNFEVHGTRNYTVHGGIVVHNCVDAAAWAVRLTLTKSAPKKRVPKPMKSWKDKLKSLMNGGDGGHMSA